MKKFSGKWSSVRKKNANYADIRQNTQKREESDAERVANLSKGWREKSGDNVIFKH